MTLAPLYVRGANHLHGQVHNVLHLSVLHQKMVPLQVYKHLLRLLEFTMRRMLQCSNSKSPPQHVALLIVEAHPCRCTHLYGVEYARVVHSYNELVACRSQVALFSAFLLSVLSLRGVVICLSPLLMRPRLLGLLPAHY